MRASCDALSTPGPFGPLLDIVPALGIDGDPLFAPTTRRDKLFVAVLSAFRARSETVVIVGEDAHWSDKASIDLLRLLIRRCGSLKLLMLITDRDDELGPLHPQQRVLGDLASAAWVHRLSLTPLSIGALRASVPAQVVRDAASVRATSHRRGWVQTTAPSLRRTAALTRSRSRAKIVGNSNQHVRKLLQHVEVGVFFEAVRAEAPRSIDRGRDSGRCQQGRVHPSSTAAKLGGQIQHVLRRSENRLDDRRIFPNFEGMTHQAHFERGREAVIFLFEAIEDRL